jgi:hypothetical protein
LPLEGSKDEHFSYFPTSCQTGLRNRVEYACFINPSGPLLLTYILEDMHFGPGPTRQKKSTKEDSLKTGKVSINCFLMWHETAFQMWPPDSLVDHSIVNYDSNLLENATKNPKSRAV